MLEDWTPIFFKRKLTVSHWSHPKLHNIFFVIFKLFFFFLLSFSLFFESNENAFLVLTEDVPKLKQSVFHCLFFCFSNIYRMCWYWHNWTHHQLLNNQNSLNFTCLMYFIKVSSYQVLFFTAHLFCLNYWESFCIFIPELSVSVSLSLFLS